MTTDPFAVIQSITLTDTSGPSFPSLPTGYEIHMLMEYRFREAIQARFRRGTETAQDRAGTWPTAMYQEGES